MGTEEEEDDDHGTSSQFSTAESTVFEAKHFIKQVHYPQAIGTCIVTSFIEHHLHRHLLSMIPTILIGQMTVRVFLYDCVADLFLSSSDVPLSENGLLSPTAVAALWMVVNHR